MALLGSAVSSEVGLRLLFCPLGSNVVVRTACCSVGIVLPVYNTFKAIENKDQNQQQKWLVYWAGSGSALLLSAHFGFSAYGSFSLAEIFADKILSWFPLYYHAKFAFLVWLQLPSADGAMQMYMRYLRPFLLRHQAKLDQITGFTYSETAKFMTAHQAEIQFAKEMFLKLYCSATRMMWDVIHPVQTRRHNAIAPPRPPPATQVELSDSDHDD